MLGFLFLLSQGLDGLGPSEAVDIVLLVDESGSMRHLDPERLSEEAAKMMMDISRLFKKPTTVSLIAFGDGARVLVPPTPAGEAYPKIKEAVGKLDRNAPKTDILAGLKTAFGLLEGRGTLEKSFVIILTDGRLDPSRDLPEGVEFFDYKHQVLSEARNFDIHGCPIYVIAFSEEAKLYHDIARATGGDFYKIESGDELAIRYLDVFKDYLGRFMASHRDVQDAVVDTVVVDTSVSEITVVVGTTDKNAVSIISPEGKPVQAEVVRERAYLILRIPNPTPGVWRIIFRERGAALYSIAIPQIIEPSGSSVRMGEPYTVKVKLLPSDTGRPLDFRDFQVTAYLHYPSGRDVSFNLYDDGQHGDDAAGDGVFARRFEAINAEGSYHLSVIVRHGPTRSEIRVRKPLYVRYRPKLEILAQSSGFLGSPIKITAQVSNRGTRFFQRETYVAEVMDPDYQTWQVELRDDGQMGDEVPGDRVFTGLFTRTGLPGRYEIKVKGDMEIAKAKGERAIPYHEEATLTHGLWLRLDGVSTPGFCLFGELAGRTYTHKLRITSFYPGQAEPRFYNASSAKEAKGAVAGPVPQVKVKKWPTLNKEGSGDVEVEAQLPGNLSPGTYRVTLSGSLQPVGTPINTTYRFKTSTMGRVFMTGFGALLVLGGIGTAVYLLTR